MASVSSAPHIVGAAMTKQRAQKAHSRTHTRTHTENRSQCVSKYVKNQQPVANIELAKPLKVQAVQQENEVEFFICVFLFNSSGGVYLKGFSVYFYLVDS